MNNERVMGILRIWRPSWSPSWKLDISNGQTFWYAVKHSSYYNKLLRNLLLDFLGSNHIVCIRLYESTKPAGYAAVCFARLSLWPLHAVRTFWLRPCCLLVKRCWYVGCWKMIPMKLIGKRQRPKCRWSRTTCRGDWTTEGVVRFSQMLHILYRLSCRPFGAVHMLKMTWIYNSL